MNKLKLHFLSLILLSSSLFLTSCLANLSKPSWGMLANGPESVMLHVPPNGSVAVCGSEPTVISNIKEAIVKWATPIERDKYIKIVDCNQTADVTISAVVTANPNGGTAAISNTTGRIEYAPGKGSFPVILHEIGHAWGLCDQYQSVNNCLTITDSSGNQHGNFNKVATSVMGPTSYDKTELTEDDIAGIKEIAKRDDIPTNAAWKNMAESIVTNQMSIDDSATDLNGTLTVDEKYKRYTFTFTPKNSSSSSQSKLRVCLLDKFSCTTYPNSNWHASYIDLQANGDSFVGDSYADDIYRAIINFPKDMFLLEVDSDGKLKQYKRFNIIRTGIPSNGTL